MAISITHSTVVAVADDGTSPVGSDEWNAALTTSMATSRILGRLTAGAGSFEELTGTNVTGMLDNVVGDSGAGGTKGLVPAPAAGDAAAGKFLKADGAWTAPSAASPGGSSGQVQYNNSSAFGGTNLWVTDTNTIEKYNSTTAQAFKVYNTFTDTSNYERGVFDWTTAANTLTIGAQAAGSGTLRPVVYTAASSHTFKVDGSAHLTVNSSNTTFNSGDLIGWGNAWLGQAATAVVGFSNGAGFTSGWFNYAGQKRVTSDVAFTSTTTLGTVTGLSADVAAGRTYSFEAYLSFTDAAAGGIKAAIAGTATATAIEYDGWVIDSAANGIKGNTQATALATEVASSTTTGTAGVVQIKGTITVNAGGTLLVQAAQNTSNGTATTIKRGSYFIVQDMV